MEFDSQMDGEGDFRFQISEFQISEFQISEFQISNFKSEI